MLQITWNSYIWLLELLDIWWKEQLNWTDGSIVIGFFGIFETVFPKPVKKDQKNITIELFFHHKSYSTVDQIYAKFQVI